MKSLVLPKKFSFAYFLVLGILLVSYFLKIEMANYVLKPQLMPILAFGYFSCSKLKNHWLLTALVFSGVGDIFLMFDRKIPSFFIFGMLFFLAAHINYILLFRKMGSFNKIAAVIIFTINISIFLVITQPMEKNILLVLMGIYTLAISLMATFAASISPFSTKIGLGSLLFIISDSILAYNQFLYPIAFAPILVMSTYGLAQFFIALGTMEREN